MYIEPWLVNLVWSIGFVWVGALIGYYWYRKDHEQIVGETVDFLAEQGFVLYKPGINGEMELIRLKEED